MKIWAKAGVICALLVPLLAAGAGEVLGSNVLHPWRRPLGPELIAQADQAFARVGAQREDFQVRARDAVLLRGWSVRPAHPNGDWVLLYHGVADNRAGVLGPAEFLLRAGYSVVMMDARAQGESEGAMATYGWKERDDTRAIVDALYARETPKQLYALGVSMGAAIALQSAAVEPRIAGVVADSAFSDLREASYDYAGLHISPWLGKTVFRLAAMAIIHKGQKEAGFLATDVSPEKAVAARPIPVLLICSGRDHTLPCRHSERIYQAATGPRQLWRVPNAAHASAFGTAPAKYERRVLAFYAGQAHPP